MNIKQEDYEGALSYYDSLADLSQPSKSLEDLVKATGLQEECTLATGNVSEIRTAKAEELFIVDLPYTCEGKRVYQKLYVSHGNWDTPNGKGKFVLPESAGKAGKPLR